jgi:hypothetical protein
MVQVQPRPKKKKKKNRKTCLLQNKPGVVVHSCGPNYSQGEFEASLGCEARAHLNK